LNSVTKNEDGQHIEFTDSLPEKATVEQSYCVEFYGGLAFFIVVELKGTSVLYRRKSHIVWEVTGAACPGFRRLLNPQEIAKFVIKTPKVGINRNFVL